MKMFFTLFALVLIAQGQSSSASELEIKLKSTKKYERVYEIELLSEHNQKFFQGLVDIESSCDGYRGRTGQPRRYGLSLLSQKLDRNFVQGYTYCESFNCFDCFHHNLDLLMKVGEEQENKALCEKFLKALVSNVKEMTIKARLEVRSERHRCANYKEDQLVLLELK